MRNFNTLLRLDCVLRMGESVKGNTDASSVLQKYWISILLLILALASFPSIYIALFAAFVFTFLVPGLIGYRFFRLKTHEIWAFVPLFSVLVSVELIYYLSLAVGYSRDTILISFLALTAIYTAVVYCKGIGHLRDAGIKVTLNVTLSEINADYFMDMISLATELGALSRFFKTRPLRKGV